MTVWGFHFNSPHANLLIERNIIANGWKEMGDLHQYNNSERLRNKLNELGRYRTGAIPIYAGLLNRYVNVMQIGDIVVFPMPFGGRIHIGEITGVYLYEPSEEDTLTDYPNRRSINWLDDFPRNHFSQAALNEAGAFLTLFKINNNRAEFLNAVNRTNATAPDTQIANGTTANVEEDIAADDDVATISVAAQAEETTSDFIIRRLMNTLSGYDFEEFIAHLLECMGYKTRVTQRSGDGGVDIIAHQDALGFQPPIIKVQCKRSTATNGDPEVNQLLGTLRQGEFGLFINLGSYSRPARLLERNDPRVRLIDGNELTQLITEHYSNFAPRYRSIIPLKMIHVPDLKDS